MRLTVIKAITPFSFTTYCGALNWNAPPVIASATGAVYTLLVAIDRRYSARRRGIDLGADFHALAQSLFRQPADAEAQGLDLDGAEVWERIMEASRG